MVKQRIKKKAMYLKNYICGFTIVSKWTRTKCSQAVLVDFYCDCSQHCFCDIGVLWLGGRWRSGGVLLVGVKSVQVSSSRGHLLPADVSGRQFSLEVLSLNSAVYVMPRFWYNACLQPACWTNLSALGGWLRARMASLSINRSCWRQKNVLGLARTQLLLHFVCL